MKMKYDLKLADCLELQDSEGFSLIYLDPPYSFASEDSYYGVGDNLHDYLSYMMDRLQHLKTMMLPDSNIIVHVDSKCVHNLKVMMDSIFGRENFRNDIVWCFSNPASSKRWLPRKHQNLLWYGQGDYAYNEQRIPYKTKMNVGGKTAWSKEKKDWEEYEAKGKILEDWWTDIPAICRNEPEKNGYATQKPLALMNRVVKLWSNEGDRVLDPFMGSGSFIESALRLGRFPVGCDKASEAVGIVEERCRRALAQDIFL
jgi:adenine-specific DNA-methyltransferase